ncbi:exopolyphosphatase [Bauldia litoralis]|uniref:exopolyphosphatase n=1 Tax=Bauldia litoralis TaxID=665467 RepID=UPI000B29F033|nr:exopolyphosphatase [Bauldia litoralis]
MVDIGSNSVRLVVYERLSRSATPIFNEKELCGLARGLEATKRLDPAAIASALAALRRYRALADQIGVSQIHVLATAAPREAENGPEFVAAVEAITGVPIHMLSGKEEAELTAYGVISGIHDAHGIAGDLGGGSLEVVDVHGDTVGSGETFPLGGLRLAETAQGSVKKAEKIIADALEKSEVLKEGSKRDFYAIGGTWRSLARLQMRQKGYPLHVTHQYAIEAGEAAEFCKMVARRDVDSLDSIEVVSRNRRPLLPYGAAVLEQVIKTMKPSRIVMSALGVREGHLYDLLSAEEKALDPLIVACEELALLRSRSPRHAAELSPWAGQAFEAIGLDETEEEQRLRHAACLLADIGWRVHPEYRGEQSLNLIAHAAFIGVDHPGRAYLALTNFYRHEGLIDEALSPRIRELAPTRYMERARALGAVLRVANMISGAMPGVMPRTRLERDGKKLVLVLPHDLAPLGGARVERRLATLAKTAGLEAIIGIE